MTIELSKLSGFGVVNQTQIELSKLSVFAVLNQNISLSTLQVSKAIQYDVTVSLNAVFVSKLTQYDILVPQNAAVNVCKFTQYIVAELAPPNSVRVTLID